MFGDHKDINDLLKGANELTRKIETMQKETLERAEQLKGLNMLAGIHKINKPIGKSVSIEFETEEQAQKFHKLFSK